jgi:L-alanine-DL-glutamate epimerase-like enolase superfamily enzyme
MKIEDVKIQVIKRDIPVPSGIGLRHEGISFIESLAEVPVVRIFTDEGIEGNGVSSLSASGIGTAQYLASLKPLLIGENPLDRERLWHKLWSISRLFHLPQPVLGAIDVALWDIGGKVANLPIYKLLGGYREKVRAYASMMQLSSVDAYVQQALQWKEKCYTAIKLHVEGIPDKDLAVCRAVRKAVGDDVVLMHDAVGLYDHQQALRVGRELEQLGFYWFEEPLPDTDIDGLIQLSNALDIPVAGLEDLPGNLYTAGEYITRGALDIIRGDVLLKGGITSLKKMAALAEAFGVKCEIHLALSPVMNAANLHVACAIKNCEFYESFVPEEVFNFGVEKDIEIDKQGYAHVPKGPGLGMKIDWDYINKLTIATI